MAQGLEARGSGVLDPTVCLEPGPASAHGPDLASRQEPGRGLEGDARRAVAPQPHPAQGIAADPSQFRSEEHTSELQSLMRISYAVFCLKKKKKKHTKTTH